ncbi:MAG TPA: LysR family transcriptional regulator [Caulobacteraceae bacterium]|nr:LysR family transcriptional regulator [Caulobacteraceae bacterium]
MSYVELRHLRYFVAVAEHLHFGRAAERLGVAQPPLSQQIQQLERIVGERLFTRRPAVRLTEAGVAFLAYARRSLEQVSQGVNAARRAASGDVGRLTIGFAASALLSPFSEVVRSYRSVRPGVELVLRELSTADQIAQLQQGRIDAGFLRMPPASASGLKFERIYREPFIAVLPPGHPLSASPSLELKALEASPFILFPREVAPSLHDQIRDLFRRAGFDPRIAVHAREWLTIVGLVEAEIGVSIVPRSFRKLGWGEVAYVPLDDVTEQTAIFLGVPDEPANAAVAGFVEVTRAVFATRSRPG